MTYDKTCGNVRVQVYDGPPTNPREGSAAMVERVAHNDERIYNLTLEDLRDLRYLIDRALEAGE